MLSNSRSRAPTVLANDRTSSVDCLMMMFCSKITNANCKSYRRLLLPCLMSSVYCDGAPRESHVQVLLLSQPSVLQTDGWHVFSCPWHGPPGVGLKYLENYRACTSEVHANFLSEGFHTSKLSDSVVANVVTSNPEERKRNNFFVASRFSPRCRSYPLNPMTTSRVLNRCK